MDKAQLDALLTAHGGRAQPVASLHLLRAPRLGAADHAFLALHAASLATIDLSRWLSHAAPSQRPAVLEALIALAEREPARFEFEIARAPHFPLKSAERTELIVRLVGRAPESLIAALSPEAGVATRPAAAEHPAEVAPPPAGEAPAEGFFDPSDILAELDFDPGFLGGEGQSSGARRASSPPDAGPAAASGGGDFLGLGDSMSLGDAPGGGDFLGLGDSLGDGDSPLDAPFGAAPASSEIATLLADLAAAKGPRARAAWKKRALAVAETGTQDWGPSVTKLPVEMRDAILLRASVSPRGDERAALLEWLLQNGGKRARLVELTVALLGLGNAAIGVYAWLARSWIPRLLADKASWSRHGAAVLGALADRRAFSEMDDIFAAASTGAGDLGPGLVAMPGASAAPTQLLAAMAAAFGAMLASSTRAALEGDRRKEALAGAAALACLGVRSRERPALATLRRKKAAKGDVATLLGLAESRARAPKDTPSLEDLVATVHVLSDALS